MSNYQYVCGNGKYCNANATTPKSPSTHIAESYQNAYETAFKAEQDRELNLYPLRSLAYGSLPSEFINGTFGYQEIYPGVPKISYLSESENNYILGQSYLFISVGSGRGNGYMYLDWIIVTFGVPYKISVPKNII